MPKTLSITSQVRLNDCNIYILTMHPKSVLISVLSLSRTSTPLEPVNPLAAMYVWLVMPQIGTPPCILNPGLMF